MSTSLLYHAFGIIGYFYQSTSYIAGAVIVAIRDDYWRLRCPVCRSRKVLGLNPVVLLGAITGSTTSGASLSVVTNAAKRSVPARWAIPGLMLLRTSY